jgi:hypothetical protein
MTDTIHSLVGHQVVLPPPVHGASAEPGHHLPVPQPLPLPDTSAVAHQWAKGTFLTPKFWPDAVGFSRHVYTLAHSSFGSSVGHGVMQSIAIVEVVDHARLLMATRRAYKVARRDGDTQRTVELGIRSLSFVAGIAANTMLLIYVIGGLAGYRLPNGQTLKDVLAVPFKGCFSTFLAMTITHRMMSIHRTRLLISEIDAELARLDNPEAAQTNILERRAENGRVSFDTDVGMSLTKDGWELVKPLLHHLQYRDKLVHLRSRLNQNSIQSGLRLLAAASAIGGQWWVGNDFRFWIAAALGTNTVVLMWTNAALGRDAAKAAKIEQERQEQAAEAAREQQQQQSQAAAPASQGQ